MSDDELRAVELQENTQRENLTDLEGSRQRLAESEAEVRDLLAACRQLGWSELPVRRVETMDTTQRKLLVMRVGPR